LEVVDWDIEEPDELPSMQIGAEHAMSTGCGQKICDELCGNWHARLHLTVLASVSEIWNHRCDAPCRSPLQSIDDDEKLHQVVVAGGGGALNDEDIAAADVIADFYGKLSVTETHYIEPS
jgi:hypothetical protein